MLKKMEFFLRQLDARASREEFRAIVVDVRSYGLVVELPDCLVTGLIHVSALPDDFYSFDSVRLPSSAAAAAAATASATDLKVIVARVDAYKRQIDFAPVGEMKPGGTRQPDGRAPVPQPQKQEKHRGQRGKGGGKPKQGNQKRRRR